LQNFLSCLEPSLAAQALAEMSAPKAPVTTMAEWLEQNFGRTLCKLFFDPFHHLYTAGLHQKIAPQDSYKSPVDLSLAIKGALSSTEPVGYNTQFIYPIEGLNVLAQRMAEKCDVRYGKRVINIDPGRKIVSFKDGTSECYETLISTLPLNHMLEMTDLEIDNPPDPYTSVLVLNIGAVRGPRCPDDHWLYNPDAKSGFHRVGFYSNVDRSFMPKSAQAEQSRLSIYVERAYVGGSKPTQAEIEIYANAVVSELQDWGYIEESEVVDPTWIDVAYTWQLPGSKWRKVAMDQLEENDIYPVGRYARWVFQGIADSIRDGFYSGCSFR
jgi:protoporphyrinogen oxidase